MHFLRLKTRRLRLKIMKFENRKDSNSKFRFKISLFRRNAAVFIRKKYGIRGSFHCFDSWITLMHSQFALSGSLYTDLSKKWSTVKVLFCEHLGSYQKFTNPGILLNRGLSVLSEMGNRIGSQVNKTRNFTKRVLVFHFLRLVHVLMLNFQSRRRSHENAFFPFLNQYNKLFVTRNRMVRVFICEDSTNKNCEKVV